MGPVTPALRHRGALRAAALLLAAAALAGCASRTTITLGSTTVTIGPDGGTVRVASDSATVAVDVTPGAVDEERTVEVTVVSGDEAQEREGDDAETIIEIGPSDLELAGPVHIRVGQEEAEPAEEPSPGPLDPDGSWAADVALEIGPNEIPVRVVNRTGQEEEVPVKIRRQPDGLTELAVTVNEPGVYVVRKHGLRVEMTPGSIRVPVGAVFHTTVTIDVDQVSLQEWAMATLVATGSVAPSFFTGFHTPPDPVGRGRGVVRESASFICERVGRGHYGIQVRFGFRGQIDVLNGVADCVDPDEIPEVAYLVWSPVDLVPLPGDDEEPPAVDESPPVAAVGADADEVIATRLPDNSLMVYHQRRELLAMVGETVTATIEVGFTAYRQSVRGALFGTAEAPEVVAVVQPTADQPRTFWLHDVNEESKTWRITQDIAFRCEEEGTSEIGAGVAAVSWIWTEQVNEQEPPTSEGQFAVPLGSVRCVAPAPEGAGVDTEDETGYLVESLDPASHPTSDGAVLGSHPTGHFRVPVGATFSTWIDVALAGEVEAAVVRTVGLSSPADRIEVVSPREDDPSEVVLDIFDEEDSVSSTRVPLNYRCLKVGHGIVGAFVQAISWEDESVIDELPETATYEDMLLTGSSYGQNEYLVGAVECVEPEPAMAETDDTATSVGEAVAVVPLLGPTLLGPCEGRAWVEGTTIDPGVSGGVYTLPRKGSGSWLGSHLAAVEGQDRVHNGSVVLHGPPPFPGAQPILITVGTWGSETQETWKRGEVSWDYEPWMPTGVPVTVSGVHNDTAGTCMAQVSVKFAGGFTDSPAGPASAALTVLFGGLLGLAGMPKVR